MDSQLFEFEADFVNSLRCVPMIVRFKLDLCGIKLSLRAWSQFGISTRARLVQMPIVLPEEFDRYRRFLTQAIAETGEALSTVEIEPQPLWMKLDRVPDVVVHKAQSLEVDLSDTAQWARLSSLQRFALVKLARGGHENTSFLPALKEFGLIA